MKRKFLKPFAATVGALLASTTANAATDTQADELRFESRGPASFAGDDIVLDHSIVSLETAAHSSHSSHASHASHASHSSHASSSF